MHRHLRQIWIFYLLCLAAPPLAYGDEQGAAPIPQSEKEAVSVRRILEFWENGRYADVEQQANVFLEEFPNSQFVDSVYVILADSASKQANYATAAEGYEKVQSPNLQQQTLLSRLHAYYRNQQWADIIAIPHEELSKQTIAADPKEQSEAFYMAEAYLHLSLQAPVGSHEAQDFAQHAATYYEWLLSTRYDERAAIALPEMYRVLGHYQEAATAYEALASRLPARSKEFLFNAASLQALYDKESAVAAFARLADKKGIIPDKALVEWMHLSYELEHYENLIINKEVLFGRIPAQQYSQIHFYLGNSYLALGDSQKSCAELTAYIKEVSTPCPQLKTALLSLLIAAREQQQWPIVQAAYTQLTEAFPDDSILAEGRFILAIATKDQGYYDEAQEMLSSILSDYPSYKSNDAVALEHALIYSDKKEWQHEHDALIAFTNDYKESPLIANAYENAIGITLQQLTSEQESEQSTALKQQLVDDFNQALAHPDKFSPDQLFDLKWQLAQTLYDQGQKEEAIAFLETLLKDHTGDQQLHNAHFLLSLCYRDAPQDLYPHANEAFMDHSEKALQGNPDLPDADKMHMVLFNSYLERAKSIASHPQGTDEGQYATATNGAANHLYLAVVHGSEDISLQNMLWLANYYYTPLVQEGSPSWYKDLPTNPRYQDALKARALYDRIFSSDNDSIAMLATVDYPMDEEVVKYAHLLGGMGAFAEELSVLQHWVAARHNEASPLVQLTLGQAYEYNGLLAEALHIYRHLRVDGGYKDPYVHAKATLQEARINYWLIPEGDRHSGNEAVSVTLSLLRDLQHQKAISTEPINLEAAYDYAEISASLAPRDEQREALITLLTKMQEDFSTTSTPKGKDYAESRALLPEKNRVYQAYMMLIKGNLAQLQSTVAADEGNTKEAEELQKTAQTLYKTLISGKFAVSSYVVNKARVGLQTLSADEHQ